MNEATFPRGDGILQLWRSDQQVTKRQQGIRGVACTRLLVLHLGTSSIADPGRTRRHGVVTDTEELSQRQGQPVSIKRPTHAPLSLLRNKTFEEKVKPHYWKEKLQLSRTARTRLGIRSVASSLRGRHSFFESSC